MRVKSIGMIATAVATLIVGAPVAADYLDIKPYIGMDAKWLHMPFKKGFGDNLAESNYPQGNVFFGIKMNDFLGVEAGYEAAVNKTRTATVSGGSTYFGNLVPALSPSFVTTTETKIHGFNANLVGFLPVSEEYALDVIGSVGLAHLKLRITHDGSGRHREFSKEKWIPRLNLGIQHMIAKQFGIRAMVGWEKTSSFGNMVPTVPSTFVAKVKDSTSLGLGLFYNFK